MTNKEPFTPECVDNNNNNTFRKPRLLWLIEILSFYIILRFQEWKTVTDRRQETWYVLQYIIQQQKHQSLFEKSFEGTRELCHLQVRCLHFLRRNVSYIYLYIKRFPRTFLVIHCVLLRTNLNFRAVKSLSPKHWRGNGVACMTSFPQGRSWCACAVLTASLAKLTTLVTFRVGRCCL